MRPAAAAKKPVEVELHDLYIEYHATAGDAGLQLSAGAEDWRQFRVLDTSRKPLIDVSAKRRLHRPFGLSELLLEASELPFTKVPFNLFKKHFRGDLPLRRHHATAASCASELCWAAAVAAAASALPASDEQRATSLVEIGLVERERFLDS